MQHVLTPKYLWIHIAIVALVGVVIGAVTFFLLAATLPTPKTLPDAVNYDDCARNGGSLQVVTDLSACVGASDKVFLQYSAQNLPRIETRKTTTTPNHVVAVGSYSADLVSFLKQDFTGCTPTGYYKVLKEVKNRFALMNYGCDNYTDAQKSSAFMIAIKLADGWSLISPTNNMRDDGMPSCLMVDMFKISKDLSAKCYETTGYSDGTTRDVVYL